MVTINAFDVIAYLVIGIVVISFTLLLAVLILHVGGSKNVYAALHFFATIAMFVYALLSELFISTPVLLLYILADIVAFLCVAVAKSNADKAKILH